MTREYTTAADGRDRKRKGEFRKRENLIAQTVRHRMLHLVNTMYTGPFKEEFQMPAMTYTLCLINSSFAYYEGSIGVQ